MRRETRKRNEDILNEKIIKYTGIGVAVLAVIVFALLMYSKNLNDEVREGTLSSEKIASILNTTNLTENTESASTEIGKSVNEASNEISNTSVNNIMSMTNVITPNDSNQQIKSQSNKTEETDSEIKEEENKIIELNFEKPVDGEIVRDFAVDSLIYSETLEEWTTHTGIDIKSDKTTVVKSSEKGIVKSIKNDPRYGLTIVVEHENGFKTIYSNLLTSEFVVEGEKVEKGQSLGTVGNTAAFEIADESHIHFEILKDDIQVDPNIYLK